jgi:hypothetical protein
VRRALESAVQGREKYAYGKPFAALGQLLAMYDVCMTFGSLDIVDLL